MRKRRSLHELADNVVVNADPLANGCRASMRNSNEDSITASSLSTVISSKVFVVFSNLQRRIVLSS